ncbi:MAG: hypothetical protein AB1Z16_05015, partial [Desulfotignum sp.]
KPGNRIDLVRDTFGASRAEVLSVERIAQSVSLTEPPVAKMDLLLAVIFAWAWLLYRILP